MRRPQRGGLREMKELMMRKTGWRSEENTRWRCAGEGAMEGVEKGK